MVIDGISYNINWRDFPIGASFFTPCIHAQQAKDAIRKTTYRLGFKVVFKVVIEDGIRGLRTWRV
jgi:hypothetical protein